MKSDVSEFDCPAGSGGRKMLNGFFTPDRRANVQYLCEATHGRIASLKQIDYPAERDHRPGKHREVHPEGDERADGDRTLDRQRAASAEYDDRAESPKKSEQRIQRSPQAYQ